MEKLLWYYVQGNQKIGPVTETVLKQLVAARVLTSSDKVLQEGLSDWITLQEALSTSWPVPPPTQPPLPTSSAAIVQSKPSQHGNAAVLSLIGGITSWALFIVSVFLIGLAKEGIRKTHLFTFDYWFTNRVEEFQGVVVLGALGVLCSLAIALAACIFGIVAVSKSKTALGIVGLCLSATLVLLGFVMMLLAP